MPQIKVSLSIGFSGAKQEDVLDICEKEWEECNGFEQQQEELMHEYWKDWSDNYIDGGFELIDD